MAKLFQYAIVYNPKTTKDSSGNDTTPVSELIVEPTFILAKDDKEVSICAGRAIPDSHLSHLDEVEIYVRPF